MTWKQSSTWSNSWLGWCFRNGVYRLVYEHFDNIKCC